MPCGCNKGRKAAAPRAPREPGKRVPSVAEMTAAAAAAQPIYEVWKGDVFLGRRFGSLVQATSYARQRGGEVRTIH